MKSYKIALLTALGAAAIAAPQAEAIHLDIANVTSAEVVFSGTTDTFTFADGVGGYDFEITGTTGVAGDALGLLGNITGTFTIGAITIAGPLQTAPVTGTGTMTIDAGDGLLTGSIVWLSASTFGTTGGFNLTGAFNYTSLAYGGINSDLQELAAPGLASATISFQFNPAKSLTALTANGTTHRTSYSGSIDTPLPDAGATLALLGVGVLGLGALRRRLA